MPANRIVRALFALFAYSSVHWASGNWRRALFWDALFVVAALALFWIPAWLLVAIFVAQVIDAALFEPVHEPSVGMLWAALCIAGLIGGPTTLLLRARWVEAFRMPSGSMIPTLEVGDHFFVAKQARTPKRGDVIVFKYPKEPDKDFIKRVVAVGGDTIEIKDDQLVVNGAPVPRKHLDTECSYDDFNDLADRWEKRYCDAWEETLDGRTYRVIFERNGRPHSTRAVTVPAGHYYVLGDNRDNSHDSRYWGFVPPDFVKGTARKIWFSSGHDGVRWDRIDTPVR